MGLASFRLGLIQGLNLHRQDSISLPISQEQGVWACPFNEATPEIPQLTIAEKSQEVPWWDSLSDQARVGSVNGRIFHSCNELCLQVRWGIVYMLLNEFRI